MLNASSSHFDPLLTSRCAERSGPGAATRAAGDWEWVIEAYGPGIIELDLDQKLREQTVRAAFLSVLRDVKTKLESFGESVPLNSSMDWLCLHFSRDMIQETRE